MALDIRCQEYFEEVRDWARKEGIEDRLQERLDYLDGYGQGPTRCVIMTDFAPRSFFLTMQRKNANGFWSNWWAGGLIYHETDRGWSVHT